MGNGCDFCNKSLCLQDTPIAVVDALWSWLMADFDKDGRVFMYAEGDDRSDHYYPKWCPECGRKLG